MEPGGERAPETPAGAPVADDAEDAERTRRVMAMLEQFLSIQDADLAGALGRAASLLVTTLGADKVDVFLYDPAQDALVAIGVSDTPMGRRERELGFDRAPVARGGRFVEVYETGVAYSSGLPDPLELPDITAALGVQSSIVVPLEVGGARLGVLAVASTRPGAFSPQDTRLLQLMAQLAGMVIERAQSVQLRAEAGRLSELDRLRADFIATVSHDLQTPLTAIRAGLGLLENSAGSRLTEDESNMLAIARANAERLRRRVNDLLVANQLEAGTFQLDLTAFDLREAVRRGVEVVEPTLHEKGQTVELDLPDPLPVRGDRARLEQVFINLLGNGQRHTPSGTRIVVRGQVADDEVRISVADNGPGIPETELEAIFQRFYRLGSGGSGLGLAVARGIIHLHRGRLWAESALGDGATFLVVLPLDTQPSAGVGETDD